MAKPVTRKKAGPSLPRDGPAPDLERLSMVTLLVNARKVNRTTVTGNGTKMQGRPQICCAAPDAQ
jgi:hypothetical protein